MIPARDRNGVRTRAGEREYYLDAGTDLSRYRNGPSRYLCLPFVGSGDSINQASVWGHIDGTRTGCMTDSVFLIEYAASLTPPDTSGCPPTTTKMGRLALPGAKLANARLRAADMAGINLQGADLSWADLKCANARDADLTDARLWNTRLDRANLSQARLHGAVLCFARVHETVFDGADLRGADLRGVEGLTVEQLCAAARLEGALLPKRLERNWAEACATHADARVRFRRPPRRSSPPGDER